jgi:hypothetical protein
MNLENMTPAQLSPAPWKVSFHGMVNPAKPWRIEDAAGDTTGWFISGEDAKQCALARNALDVMMRRRGWSPCWFDHYKQWGVDTGKLDDDGNEIFVGEPGNWFMRPDPFTSLVEADKYIEQKEGNPCSVQSATNP